MLSKFYNHQGFQRYFKNASWLFMERFVRIVTGLFVGIWVARYLGPEQFGLLSFAQALVGMFTAIAALGLDRIVVRNLVTGEQKINDVLGTAFVLKIIGAAIVLLLLAIAIPFTSNDAFTNILVFIIASATIFQSFNVIDFYFQSKVLSQYSVFANVFSLLISSIVKVALILYEAPLIYFAWVVLFDSVVLACGYVYVFLKHKELNLLTWNFDKDVAVYLLKDSWPLIAAGVALAVNQRVDQVMIKEFLGLESAGLYAAAVKYIDVFASLIFIGAKSVFPLFVKAYDRGEWLFEHRIVVAYRVFLVGGLLLALHLYFFSNEIVLFSFGDAYKMAGEIFKVYSCLLIFVAIGAVNMLYLRVLNLQKKTMFRHLVNVFLNISLNYYFIPRFGLLAAAYTSLFSIIFTTIMYDLDFFSCWLSQISKYIFTKATV